ncbi:RNA 3'-terminal phosphate cyclase [Candidatus Woesearchaeota archaeon]|nr:MAG: RNA 3'-terminal phosphate cyclase [Candidatus Woesearchaeota archaeon]
MISLDGSHGEGGGQIVRTALALSTITGKPFMINNIRSGREKSGLKNQHVHCIKALKQLCNAEVEGCFLGSPSLTYQPKKIVAKDISINIGTAGSITLFMQSVLLPCLYADKPILLTVEGGTDVRWAQPIDYFSHVFLNVLHLPVTVEVQKRGFYPKGEGVVACKITPASLKKIQLLERGDLVAIKGVSVASDDLQDLHVLERQTKAVLELFPDADIVPDYQKASSTGSGITLFAQFEKTILGADVLGEKEKESEELGKEVAEKLLQEINSDAVIDSHCADALIPFLGMAKGALKTSQITKHLLSNIYVTEKFLDVKFRIEGTTVFCD